MTFAILIFTISCILNADFCQSAYDPFEPEFNEFNFANRNQLPDCEYFKITGTLNSQKKCSPGNYCRRYGLGFKGKNTIFFIKIITFC